MPDYTTNYSLKKPLGNENFTKDDQNGNMDLIDQALKNNADAIATKETPTGAQAKADAAEAAAKNTSVSHTLATAVNDFIVASGAGTFVKKTLAEVKATLGLGSAAYTNSSAYATAAQGAKADVAIPSSQKGAVGGVAEYDTVATHLTDYANKLFCDLRGVRYYG